MAFFVMVLSASCTYATIFQRSLGRRSGGAFAVREKLLQAPVLVRVLVPPALPVVDVQQGSCAIRSCFGACSVRVRDGTIAVFKISKAEMEGTCVEQQHVTRPQVRADHSCETKAHKIKQKHSQHEL